MWVVVEREIPAFTAGFTFFGAEAPESRCTYDLCEVGPDQIALRVATYTDRETVLRTAALLNRHGMEDAPLPEVTFGD